MKCNATTCTIADTPKLGSFGDNWPDNLVDKQRKTNSLEGVKITQ